MRRIVMDDPSNSRVDLGKGKSAQKAHHTWFRGDHCNYIPKDSDLLTVDGVKRFVIGSLAPEKPCIDPQTKIVAFGSCFAANITKWLSRRKFNVLTSKDGDSAETYLVRCGEGMVNSFVIRQQFEWALTGKVFSEPLWHGYDAEEFGYDEQIRNLTQKLFSSADVFIITLGLSEIWYDEVTGGVFWRAVPQDKHDPSRHKFRVSSVDENRDNLIAIVKLIRQVRPEAKIIFTLSPIPLVATFRDAPCIVANSVSKAILRTAVDEVIRSMPSDEIYYWPSYEIVREVFWSPWRERRHVEDAVLDFIMMMFEEVWCTGTEARMSLTQAWVNACAASKMIPRVLPDAIEKQKIARLETFFLRDERRDGIAAGMIVDRMREVAKADPTGPLARWMDQKFGRTDFVAAE